MTAKRKRTKEHITRPEITVSLDFHRTFELFAYLSAFAGILAIAYIENSPLGPFIFIICALVSLYFSKRGLYFSVSSLKMVLLFVSLFAFLCLDYWLFTGNFLISLAHVLIAFQLIKLFQRKKNADYIQILTVSFLHILMAAGFSPPPFFIIIFSFYVFVSCISLVLYFVKKDAEEFVSKKVKRKRAWKVLKPTGKFFSPGLYSFLFLLVFWIIFLTYMIFPMIPRIKKGKIVKGNEKFNLERESFFKGMKRDGKKRASHGKTTVRKIRFTGFGNKINLGDFGKIKRDDSIAFTVKYVSKDMLPSDKPILLRGAMFDKFDGKTWRKRKRHFSLVRDKEDGKKDGWIRFCPISRSVPTEKISLKFFKIKLRERALFVLAPVDSIKTEALYVDEEYNLRFPTGTINKKEYVCFTRYPVPSKMDLRRVKVDKTLKEVYMLDGGDYPRMKRLAEKLTHGKKTLWGKVRAIQFYLTRNFGYSLTAARTSSKRPLNDFLFRRKEGHCEFFASAMVVMLRIVGVPARLVAGFAVFPSSFEQRKFIVRNSHAHAWVEVFFGKYRWVAFDPTPSTYLSSAKEVDDSLPPEVEEEGEKEEEFFDAIKNFDAEKQEQFLSRFKQHLKEGQDIVLSFAAKNFTMASAALIAIILTVLVILKRKKRVSPFKVDREKPPVIHERFYEKMLKILAKRGFRKGRSETPYEFSKSVIGKGGENYRDVDTLTEIFCSSRYGGREIKHETKEQIKDILANLKKVPSERDGVNS